MRVPLTASDPTLGGRIRQARGTRRLRWLAAQVGCDPAHLSRVENGERQPSLELLTKIENVLQLREGELAELAPSLPSAVANSLGDSELALAVGRGEALDLYTYSTLRRIHLARVAERFLRTVPGIARPPIDPTRLAAARRIAVSTSTAPSAAPVKMTGDSVVVAGPAGTLNHRFWISHAVGHALLENTECAFDSAADVELDASAIASFLLVPRSELKRESSALRAGMKPLDMWDATDALNFIARLGTRFGAPVWIVARRLGEDGELAETAKVDER